MLVLVFAFGSLVAAGVPLLLGLLSTTVSLGVVSPGAGTPHSTYQAQFSASWEIDLWGRIRAGFALEELDTPLVKEHEAWNPP